MAHALGGDERLVSSTMWGLQGMGWTPHFLHATVTVEVLRELDTRGVVG